jgi:hypothetical protein
MLFQFTLSLANVQLDALTGTIASHSGFEAAKNTKLAPAVCGREFREQYKRDFRARLRMHRRR